MLLRFSHPIPYSLPLHYHAHPTQHPHKSPSRRKDRSPPHTTVAPQPHLPNSHLSVRSPFYLRGPPPERTRIPAAARPLPSPRSSAHGRGGGGGGSAELRASLGAAPPVGTVTSEPGGADRAGPPHPPLRSPSFPSVLPGREGNGTPRRGPGAPRSSQCVLKSLELGRGAREEAVERGLCFCLFSHSLTSPPPFLSFSPLFPFFFSFCFLPFSPLFPLSSPFPPFFSFSSFPFFFPLSLFLPSSPSTFHSFFCIYFSPFLSPSTVLSFFPLLFLFSSPFLFSFFFPLPFFFPFSFLFFLPFSSLPLLCLLLFFPFPPSFPPFLFSPFFPPPSFPSVFPFPFFLSPFLIFRYFSFPFPLFSFPSSSFFFSPPRYDPLCLQENERTP